MQNARMLLASTTLLFRVHTRVLLTLFVALSIAIFSLTGSTQTSVTLLAQVSDKSASQSALPLKPSQTELPRTVIRLFFLVPHLLPHDN